MAAIPESAKLFMSGLIERARKLKKTIVFPEGDGSARARSGGAPGARRRCEAGADRRPPGECAGGSGVRRSRDFAAGEEVRRPLLRAAARQGHDAGGSGGGRQEAALLRVPDGGRGRCRWQRGRRGEQHGGDGPRGAARGGRASAGAAGIERVHHGAAGPDAGPQRADGVRRLRGGDGAERDADGGYRDRHRGERARADRRGAGGGAAQLFDQGQRHGADGRTRWWRRWRFCARALRN